MAGRHTDRDPTGNGWSDILGDATDEKLNTRADMEATQATPMPDDVHRLTTDPVLAAMAELEATDKFSAPTVAAPPPDGARPSRDTRPPTGGRPRRSPPSSRGRRPAAPGGPPPLPSPAAQNQPREASKPAAASGRLTLPVPGGPGATLSPPSDDDTPPVTPAFAAAAGPSSAPAGRRGITTTPRRAPPPRGPPTPRAGPAGFSSEELYDRLNEDAPPRRRSEGHGAYRELYITVAAVTAVFIGAVVYQVTRPPGIEIVDPAPDRPKTAGTGRSPYKSPSASPARTDAPTEESPIPATADAEPERPSRAPRRPARSKRSTGPTATPMLSIVTTPRGAIVDINGVVYGRTPLIMPSPQNESSLSVTLKLPGHRTLTEVLTRNEGGHFSLNVRLQPN